MKQTAKKLVREPLVHFLLIGGALFVIFGLFNDPAGQGADRIVITSGKIEFLKANFTRTWQRPPSEQELQGLVESHIREEIFYREALALGLDKDDATVRRRLMLKLETLSDDLAEAAPPSDEELERFLEANPERFRIEPRVSFRQVFVNIDKRGEGALNEADRLLAELGREENADLETMGDSLMLPASYDLSPAGDIARLFGESFSAAIMKAKPGKWTGPIRSGYGLHLVLVQDLVAGRLPELEEVREVVEREWLSVQKQKMRDSIYSRLRKRYTVVFTETQKQKNFQAASEAQAAEVKPQ